MPKTIKEIQQDYTGQTTIEYSDGTSTTYATNQIAIWNTAKTALIDLDTGLEVSIGGGGGGGSSGLATGRTISVGSAAVLTDEGTIVQANSASSIALTIPNDSTVSWAVDTVIAIYQVGVGVASFTQGSGVTLRVPSSYVASSQYDTIFARRVGANEWVVSK